MVENISKVQRWLDLITYLIGRRFPVPVEDLMEGLPAYARDWVGGDQRARDSVRRKFERDKDELRDLGIPLETVTYSINYGAEEVQGYRISRSDFYLPYLKILKEGGRGLRSPGTGTSPDAGESGLPGSEAASHSGPAAAEDAVAGSENLELFHIAPDGSLELPREVAQDAMWGLKEVADLPAFPWAGAARSAFRKLTFDLDPEVLRGSSGKDVLFATPPATGPVSQHLETLSDALLRRKKATFAYHGIQRDAKTHREVRPFGLLFKNSHWYLVGWDETREAQRIFRVDRMDEVRVNPSAPATPDYEMPDEPVLEAYRNREAWELGEAEEVIPALVRFSFPLSLWAERNGYGNLVHGAGEGGATVRQFEVRQPDPFLRWVLSLQGEAVIESPPSLTDAFHTLAQRVADLYRRDANA